MTIISLNNRPNPHAGMLAAALSVFVMAAGCDYSTQRPFRKDIQTVHVEMMQSREFRRELEFNLTEALAKRINMDSPYRISDKHHADTILSGEVLEVRQNVMGNQFPTDQPREIAATVIIRYRWKDQRSGDILVERPRFLGTVTYIPPAGESFTKGVAVRGLDQLAERMVETMETDW